MKSDQPVLRVLMLNMSDQKRFVDAGFVLGRAEAVNVVKETFQRVADSKFLEPEGK